MIPRVCALALLAAIFGAMLQEFGFRSKRLFITFCLLLLLSAASEPLNKIFEGISSLSALAGVSEAAKCALKAVGLGYVFGITSDICRELGETGIASAVTVVGRLEIFLVVFPYFEETVKLGVELLK